MTRNDRKTIPRRIADAVLYEADLLCCVCEARGQHIHHIDNDPSNNTPDNLVLLCFAHHDEVTTRGGLQRRLTPSLLRKYRSALYRRVALKRSAPRSGASHRLTLAHADEFFQLMLDAVAIRHIQSLRLSVSIDALETVRQMLAQTSAYVDDSAFRGRREILDWLVDLANEARFQSANNLAMVVRELCRLAYEAIPISTVRRKTRSRLSSQDFELLEYGLAIGGQLAYDGALYSRNLALVDAGAELLWKILRYARINGLRRLRERATEEFNTAYDAARRAANADAQALIHMYKEHGEHGDWHYPAYPGNLREKIYMAEQGTDRA